MCSLCSCCMDSPSCGTRLHKLHHSRWSEVFAPYISKSKPFNLSHLDTMLLKAWPQQIIYPPPQPLLGHQQHGQTLFRATGSESLILGTSPPLSIIPMSILHAVLVLSLALLLWRLRRRQIWSLSFLHSFRIPGRLPFTWPIVEEIAKR